MTNSQYVIRTAQLKGLSLIKPTIADRGVMAYDFNKKDARGIFPCVIDAKDWKQAKEQVIAYYQA